MPNSKILTTLPVNVALIIIAFPFVFFSIVPFLQRKQSLKDAPFIGKYISRKFNTQPISLFISKLKPVLLFAVGCFSLGLSGIISTFFVNNEVAGYILGGFFVSGGLGLLVSILLSIKYPPRLQ